MSRATPRGAPAVHSAPAIADALRTLLHVEGSSPLFTHLPGDTHTAQAFCALEAHLTGTDGSADERMCERLLCLIAEFAAGKARHGRRHGRTAQLLRWLLEHPQVGDAFRTLVARLLVESGGPSDARQQLVILSLLSTIYEANLQREPSRRMTSCLSRDLRILRALRQRGFSDHSCAGTHVAPTLLAVSATDAALLAGANLCACAANLAPTWVSQTSSSKTVAPTTRPQREFVGNVAASGVKPSSSPSSERRVSRAQDARGDALPNEPICASAAELVELQRLLVLAVRRRSGMKRQSSSRPCASRLLTDAAAEEMLATLPPSIPSILNAAGVEQAASAQALMCGSAPVNETRYLSAIDSDVPVDSLCGDTTACDDAASSQNILWSVEDAMLWAEALPLLREMCSLRQNQPVGTAAHAGVISDQARSTPLCVLSVDAIASPWLHSIGCASSPLRKHRMNESKHGLESTDEDNSSTQGGDVGHRGLVCLCLLAAALSPAERSAFFVRHGAGLFPPIAAACAACTGAALPLALLRAMLPVVMHERQDAVPALSPLLDALQCTGEASPVAAVLAADMALAHPSLVLPDILKLLSSRLGHQRANALAVLRAAGVQLGLYPQTERSRLANALVELVLPSLGDNDLGSHLLEAGLFEHVEPVQAISKLAPLLLSRNARKRTIAESALLKAMAGTVRSDGDHDGSFGARGAQLLGARRAESVAAAIVDVLRDGPVSITRRVGDNHTCVSLCMITASNARRGPVPSHPGEIGPSLPIHGPERIREVVNKNLHTNGTTHHHSVAGWQGLDGGDDRDGLCEASMQDVSGDTYSIDGDLVSTRFTNRVLRVLDKWCVSLDSTGWDAALRVVCAKFFASAEDRASLRVLRHLVAHEQCAVHCHVLVRAALSQIRQERAEACRGRRGDASSDHTVSNANSKESSQGDKPSNHDITLPVDTGNAHEDKSALARVRPLLMLSLLPEDVWVQHCSDPQPFDGKIDRNHDGEKLVCGVAIQNPCVDHSDKTPLTLAIPELRECLLERAEDTSELRQTRKLATSLLARLPPGQLLAHAMECVKSVAEGVLLHPADGSTTRHDRKVGDTSHSTAADALDRVRSSEANAGCKWVRSKANICSIQCNSEKTDSSGTIKVALDGMFALFYLCCAVSLHTIAALQVSESPVMSTLIDAACSHIDGQEAAQVQAGCKDCLARLITKLIEPHGHASDGSMFVSCRKRPAEQILNSLIARHMDQGARDVLVMASQLLHARHGPDAAWALARQVIPSLLQGHDSCDMVTLFSLAYHARTQLDARLLHVLLLRALADTNSPETNLRLAALKMLGLILADGGSAAVWGDRPETLLSQVLQRLASLATIDPSRDIRSLAQSLETAAFGGRVMDV